MDANKGFLTRLDVQSKPASIVSGQCPICIFSVLEYDLRSPISQSRHEVVRVFGVYLISIGILSAVVAPRRQVVTFVGARSRDLHRVEQVKATGEFRHVRSEEIPLGFMHLDIRIVMLPQPN